MTVVNALTACRSLRSTSRWRTLDLMVETETRTWNRLHRLVVCGLSGSFSPVKSPWLFQWQNRGNAYPRQSKREGQGFVFMSAMAKKTRSLKKVMTGKDPSYPWKFSGQMETRSWFSVQHNRFKVLYVAEAIVLASTLCFFHLCGCYHIRVINDWLVVFSLHPFFLPLICVHLFSLGFQDSRACI